MIQALQDIPVVDLWLIFLPVVKSTQEHNSNGWLEIQILLAGKVATGMMFLVEVCTLRNLIVAMEEMVLIPLLKKLRSLLKNHTSVNRIQPLHLMFLE